MSQIVVCKDGFRGGLESNVKDEAGKPYGGSGYEAGMMSSIGDELLADRRAYFFFKNGNGVYGSALRVATKEEAAWFLRNGKSTPNVKDMFEAVSVGMRVVHNVPSFDVKVGYVIGDNRTQVFGQNKPIPDGSCRVAFDTEHAPVIIPKENLEILVAENGIPFVKGEWYKWVKHKKSGLMFVKFESMKDDMEYIIQYSAKVSVEGMLTERGPMFGTNECEDDEFAHATEKEVSQHIHEKRGVTLDISARWLVDIDTKEPHITDFVHGRWYKWVAATAPESLLYIKCTRMGEDEDEDGDDAVFYNEHVLFSGEHTTHNREEECDREEFVDATEKEVFSYIASKGKQIEKSKPLHAKIFVRGAWYKWDKQDKDDKEDDSRLLYAKVKSRDPDDDECVLITEWVNEDGEHIVSDESAGDGEFVAVNESEVAAHIFAKGKEIIENSSLHKYRNYSAIVTAEQKSSLESIVTSIQQKMMVEGVVQEAVKKFADDQKNAPPSSPLYFMEMHYKSHNVTAKCTDKDGNPATVTASSEGEARDLAAERNLNVDYVITE